MHSRRQGFTLVELMVATAVLSLLLLMLTQVASMLGNTWSSGHGRAERRQNGRALVDFIGQEIRSAALPVDRMVASGTPDLQFVVNPASIDARFCQPQAVFWQAPLATDVTLSDMAVIGYFVRWQPAAGGRPPRASLCRVFINPGTAGDPATPNPHHRIYTHETDWITDAILNEVAPADYGSSYLGLFADHVIGFWVRCLDEAGQPLLQGAAQDGHFDSRLGYTGKQRDASGTLVSVTHAGPALPHSVEISLALLDARAAESLNEDLAAAIKTAAAASSSGEAGMPADHFMREMQGNPAMRRIVQGMSTHSLRVYLENAP